MTASLLRTVRKPLVHLIPQPSGPDKKPMATVMQGLRLTLEDSRLEVLLPRLAVIDTEWRGFAYEGVGIALAVYDSWRPKGRRLVNLVSMTADTYIISIYIGAGMGLAMLRNKRPDLFLAQQEQPVLRWMIMNGYGFFRGFFARKRYIAGQAQVPGLEAYAHRIFDQGLGRAIWFANTGNIEQIVATIKSFPAERQIDLWNGVGFTCAYVGHPTERAACATLFEQAGPYRVQLAVAGALAAHRRAGSGLVPPYTDAASDVFCGMSGEAAAEDARLALAELHADSGDNQHKQWRERIEATFASRLAAADSAITPTSQYDAVIAAAS